MGDEVVGISLEKEDVKKMGLDEKLNILVDIAFANHLEIKKQNKLLTGNGEKGLCEDIRANKKAIAWLWAVFCAVSGAYFTVLVIHVFRG